MKRIMSLIIILGILLSISTVGAASTSQYPIKELKQNNIDEYNLLYQHYKEANNQALKYILENKTMEGLSDFRTSEYEMYIREHTNNKSDFSVKSADSIELINIIDGLIIDDTYSTIYIYSDSSFIIESMKFTDTFNDKILEATLLDISMNSADRSKTYVIENFSIPTRSPIRTETSYTINLGLTGFQLNTFVDVKDSNTVDLAYHNTNGTYNLDPYVSIEASSRELDENNLSNMCFTEGMYTTKDLLWEKDHFIQKAVVLEYDKLLVTSYFYFDR
ncbi:hypothetical protein Amet_0122 [Alkaliphilus metalliredigens QYMF]|uniref:Uncharacterized protein n=1 Tax=Alkaliphilus metalliredigens (strain QYMF) TaxID=293826 RepID=A6TJJ4_ALKMQ|nr:hypothetical protein [Alkaliphilus metalliredigens]ABR46362.1 hypothetical protein Amet_0122 [Alkaliphilus metalliredigens QYMF]